MKFLEFISPQHSLATRLTLWVVLTIVAIFTALTILLTTVTSTTLVKGSTRNAHNRMQIYNQKVNGTFIGVETAIENVIPNVESCLNTPDKIYDILTTLLKRNPSIVGSAVAFEPYYYPSKGEQFSPYAYKTIDSTIVVKQLGTNDYEYHYMDWYQIPKLLKKNYWSEPYYDKGGGEQMMTTYSRPLYDKDGNIYAIMTADLSSDWLSDMLAKSDIQFNEWLLNEDPKSSKQLQINDDFFSSHAYSFIIGRGGTYITHPDKERILRETFFVSAIETPDSADDRIGYSMLRGETGVDKLSRDGTNYYMAYAPIERTGWSMATVIPANTITNRANRFALFIGVIMLFGVLIIYIVCRIALRRIIKPLERFSLSAKEIAKGNFNTPLPEIKSKDEMHELYNSFQTMQSSLTDRIEELKIANEQKGRIEGELQIARNIQMSMIPKTFPAFPDRNDVDIFAKLTPAKEVGGDLYDFFIRNEKLYFCIGDVAGKGVPSSLIMAVTRSLFRTVTNNESSPAKIATLISNAMAEDNKTVMFVTFFIGILDLPTGQLSYCNAGHCEPLIIHDKASFLPCVANIPIGVFADYKYQEQKTVIVPNSTIFVFTDGLNEAENINQDLFGNERIMDTAKHIIEEGDITPIPVFNKMEEAVTEFVKGAEQSDDLTMMAIFYNRKEETERLRRTLTLPNDLDAIPKLNEFINGVCNELKTDNTFTLNMNLAVEEIVVNVIQYAYPKDTQGEVEVEVIANDKQLTFVILDSGVPFDPTKKEKVDTTLSAEERPIGGLGIHLVREIMDSINYEYTNHKNILTLRKNLLNSSKHGN